MSWWHHNTTPALVPIDLVHACILSQPLVQALHSKKVWLTVLLHDNESFSRLYKQFDAAQKNTISDEKTLIGPK